METIFKYKEKNWRDILSLSGKIPGELKRLFGFDKKGMKSVTSQYPMLINPYYFSLIKKKDDPIWIQCVPDIKEVQDCTGSRDPLFEEIQAPVPNLIHRYPDRVVFMVSDKCAMYCRFCMRKRRTGKGDGVTGDTVKEGIKYIRSKKSIKEVILSGGDPLLLEDEVLYKILKQIRDIPHVEIIRIHTRIPCTLPQRITEKLSEIIKKFHPVYINIHFNHPDEITPESEEACFKLVKAGIPLGSQTVLLKGVNDSSAVITRLMRKLIKIRVRPYYIHHTDPVMGTAHFRTSIKTGLEIISSLRGYISGMCVPHYMLDLPDGKGKVPLLPGYVKKNSEGRLIIANYKGKLIEYPQ